MEKEAANDNPQLSKRARETFKCVTGSVSKGDGFWDIATMSWTTPGGTKVARGHQAVGAVVSEDTHSISSAQTAEDEFCEEYRSPVHEAVDKLSRIGAS